MAPFLKCMHRWTVRKSRISADINIFQRPTLDFSKPSNVHRNIFHASDPAIRQYIQTNPGLGRFGRNFAVFFPYISGQTIATSTTWLFQDDVVCEIPTTWYLPDDLDPIYTYTHIHIHIYMYIYIHICTYIYLRARPRAGPWALRYMFVHICTCMYM